MENRYQRPRAMKLYVKILLKRFLDVFGINPKPIPLQVLIHPLRLPNIFNINIRSSG